MAEDLGKQVELQAQLNKLLQDRIKLQNELNAACGKQCAQSNEMNAAAEKAAGNQQRQVAGQEKITQAQEKARKSQEKSGKTADGFFGKITKGQAAAGGGIIGLVRGFKDMGVSLSGIGGLIKGFVSGLFSIGAAIIKLPFKIFSGLIGMANNMAQAGVALRQAYEDVRKEFGSFAEGPAKNVLAGFKDMNKSANNLAGTGLSVSQVYGYGPDGMAAMMKDVAEIAKGLGAAMNLLGDEFGKVAQKAAMFKKGMGLSGEQMGKLMKDAKLSGKSQTDMMTEVGSMSLQMAKKFGLSSKDIARDIADMKGDFVTFGNVSTTQMGAASAYARKLGMTMKDLKGVVDKFDNFEGAADSVSQLNQAFGLQLDTMKMMNAENPAERIDMLRESFFAAGKSIENMTRQEKKLLQQQTGLTEAAMKSAFAAENQGVAYDDFADAAADAEEKQLSEKEVMLQLAKAIEKITKLGPKFTGIFDAFFQGFGKGMAYQPEFKKLLKTIYAFLKTVYHFGRDIGRIFAELLGDLGILGNLTKIFSPASAKAFFKDIVSIVEELKGFLLTGQGNPDKILQKFADRFSSFFASKGGAAAGLGEGMKRLGMIITKLFTIMTGWLWKKVSPILLSVFDKAAKWMSSNYKPIGEFIGKWVIAPLLILAFMKGIAFSMGGILVKMLVTKFAAASVAAAATAQAGAVGAAAATQTPGLVAWLKSLGGIPAPTIVMAGKTLVMLAAIFTGSVIAFALAIAGSVKILKGVSWGEFAKTLVVVGVAMAATAGMVMAAQGLAAIEPMIPTAIAGLVAVAAVFTVGMVAYAGAIWAVSKILSGISFSSFAKSLGMVGLAILATVAMVAIAAPLGAPPSLMAIGLAVLGAGAAAALFTGGMLAYGGAIKLLDSILPTDVIKRFPAVMKSVGGAMLATVGFLGLAAIGILATIGFPLIVAGLVAAAALFTGGMMAYADAIAEVDRKFKIKPGFEKKLAMVGDIVETTALMLKISGKFGIAQLIGFGGPSIEAGAAFFIESGPMLFKMVQSIDKIKVPNPKKTAAVVGIVKDLILAMSKLKELAPEQGFFSSIATMLSGGSPTALVKEMGTFVTSIMDKLQECVKGFVFIAGKMSKKDLEKGRVVAGIVKSIADVAAAMAPTLKAIAESSDYNATMKYLSGGTVAVKTNAVLEGMTGMFDILMEKLPPFITSLVDVMSKAMAGKDPKTVTEQAKALGGIMSAVKDVMGAVGDFQKMISKQDDWKTSTKGAFAEVEKMFTLMSDLIAPGGAINKMIKGMIDLADQIKGAATIDVAGMKTGLKVMSEIAGSLLPELSSGMQKMSEVEFPDITSKTGFIGGGPSIKEQILTSFETMSDLVAKGSKKLVAIKGIDAPFDALKTAMTGIEAVVKGFDSKYFGADGQVVKAAQGLVESYNATYAALGSITNAPMDLSVKLQTFADAMGVDSTTFTINNEKLNFTVNINVELDAEKLSDTLTDKPVMGKKTMQLSPG